MNNTLNAMDAIFSIVILVMFQIFEQNLLVINLLCVFSILALIIYKKLKNN